MALRFSEQVAFITGGSTGIGKAVALALAREGARVAICARHQAEMDAVAKLSPHPDAFLTVPADVSQDDQLEAAVKTVVDRWGRLDLVLANAGVNGVWAPIEELSAADWDHTININLRGTFMTVKFATPYLKKQGGAIVITSSVNGTRMFSNTGATIYATSKAGQAAMGKMLANELAPARVRVNIICPGSIQTEIEESTKKRDLKQFEDRVQYPEGEIPLTGGKPGTAEEVADLVLFLMSDRARHITGTEVWIDGAQSLLQG